MNIFQILQTDQNTISFDNYKINYDKPLGSGKFGTVYSLTKRPKNEKNWFSYLFPYAYDYAFRPDPNDSEEEQRYCIKVSKTALKILLENRKRDLPLRLPVFSFFQPQQEKNFNTLLRRYGVSNIEFFQNYFYAQFKSRIHGNTLEYYLENNKFYKPEAFDLRRSFVLLLSKISEAPLEFEDVISRNIMYDEQEFRWEIVDGNAWELSPKDTIEKEDRIGAFFDNLFSPFPLPQIFNELTKYAVSNEEYTKEIDAQILSLSKNRFCPVYQSFPR